MFWKPFCSITFCNVYCVFYVFVVTSEITCWSSVWVSAIKCALMYHLNRVGQLCISLCETRTFLKNALWSCVFSVQTAEHGNEQNWNPARINFAQWAIEVPPFAWIYFLNAVVHVLWSVWKGTKWEIYCTLHAWTCHNSFQIWSLGMQGARLLSVCEDIIIL